MFDEYFSNQIWLRHSETKTILCCFFLLRSIFPEVCGRRKNEMNKNVLGILYSFGIARKKVHILSVNKKILGIMSPNFSPYHLFVFVRVEIVLIEFSKDVKLYCPLKLSSDT